MSIFKQKEVIFLKKGTKAQKQLEALKALRPKLTLEGQAIIGKDIKCLEAGIAGEKNIEFELKNSYMDMFVLHDVYLEVDGLSAQIDYLIFTEKFAYVVECKNLYGNIEITNNGEFIREMQYGSRVKKEGIYSPITQNQRHLQVMKKVRIENKNNVVLKMITNKFFDNQYKTIVVLANPKTILKASYAKQEIKNQVIRADQLIEYIKNTNKECNDMSLSKKQIEGWANNFLKAHKKVEKDYTKKYISYLLKNQNVAKVEKNQEIKMNENVLLYQALKRYRLEKSRKENVKPYFIYNNKQLENIIESHPKTKAELLNLHGFGEVKVNKYGDDIINILNLHS